MFDVRLEDIPLYQTGLKKGMEKGLKLGEKKAALRAILLYLEKRFHVSPSELKQARSLLESKSTAELEELYEQLLRLQNASEFFKLVVAPEV